MAELDLPPGDQTTFEDVLKALQVQLPTEHYLRNPSQLQFSLLKLPIPITGEGVPDSLTPSRLTPASLAQRCKNLCYSQVVEDTFFDKLPTIPDKEWVSLIVIPLTSLPEIQDRYPEISRYFMVAMTGVQWCEDGVYLNNGEFVTETPDVMAQCWSQYGNKLVFNTRYRASTQQQSTNRATRKGFKEILQEVKGEKRTSDDISDMVAGTIVALPMVFIPSIDIVREDSSSYGKEGFFLEHVVRPVFQVSPFSPSFIYRHGTPTPRHTFLIKTLTSVKKYVPASDCTILYKDVVLINMKVTSFTATETDRHRLLVQAIAYNRYWASVLGTPYLSFAIYLSRGFEVTLGIPKVQTDSKTFDLSVPEQLFSLLRILYNITRYPPAINQIAVKLEGSRLV